MTAGHATSQLIRVFRKLAVLRGTHLVVQSLCGLGLVGRGPL
jgi:hypothetical protein